MTIELNDKYKDDNSREDNARGNNSTFFNNPILNNIVIFSTGILSTLVTQYIIACFAIEPRIVEAQKLLGEKDKISAGVTAMEGIIHDSPKSQWRIVNILTDTIHKYSPAPAKDKLDVNGKAVSNDIKNILNLIKLRDTQKDEKNNKYGNGDGTINLSSSNLFDANLNKAKLSNVDLSISYLYLIDMQEAELRNAILKGAYLRHAILNRSDLEGAKLTGYPGDKAGSFINTDLIGAKLVDTNLNNADLTGVKFFDTNLKGAKLKQAKLDAATKIKQACNWHLAKYSQKISSLLKQNEEDSELDQRASCKKFDRTEK
jgi:hypothetical protein